MGRQLPVFADPYRPVELASRIFHDTFRLLNVTPIERVFDGTLYDQRRRRDADPSDVEGGQARTL